VILGRACGRSRGHLHDEQGTDEGRWRRRRRRRRGSLFIGHLYRGIFQTVLGNRQWCAQSHLARPHCGESPEIAVCAIIVEMELVEVIDECYSESAFTSLPLCVTATPRASGVANSLSRAHGMPNFGRSASEEGDASFSLYVALLVSQSRGRGWREFRHKKSFYD